MNTTNKTAVEEIVNKYWTKKLTLTLAQDLEKDIIELLTQAHQQGEREVQERIKPFVERVRLDVEVIVCNCGEKYKDSDLDISVGDLEKALQQPLPDKE